MIHLAIYVLLVACLIDNWNRRYIDAALAWLVIGFGNAALGGFVGWAALGMAVNLTAYALLGSEEE